MRIIAGAWKGRALDTPRGRGTRPTSDRAREGVFSSLVSILGAGLGGEAVLDAFAGSGALGLEALSRGVPSATFVESDRAARASLERNLRALGAADRARVVAGDALRLAGKGTLPGGPFGLLFIDPPYRIDAARVAALLTDLVAVGAVKEGAFVVYEHARGARPGWPDGFEEVRSRRYGIAEVTIAEFHGEER